MWPHSVFRNQSWGNHVCTQPFLPKLQLSHRCVLYLPMYSGTDLTLVTCNQCSYSSYLQACCVFVVGCHYHFGKVNEKIQVVRFWLQSTDTWCLTRDTGMQRTGTQQCKHMCNVCRTLVYWSHFDRFSESRYTNLHMSITCEYNVTHVRKQRTDLFGYSTLYFHDLCVVFILLDLSVLWVACCVFFDCFVFFMSGILCAL